MGDRPSGDVDLFTGWQHRGQFPELIAAVVAALEDAGYKVPMNPFSLPSGPSCIPMTPSRTRSALCSGARCRATSWMWTPPS